ncbi:MAG: polysaccharide deacetylase family protein [Elusimicrobiales bacterium]
MGKYAAVALLIAVSLPSAHAQDAGNWAATADAAQQIPEPAGMSYSNAQETGPERRYEAANAGFSAASGSGYATFTNDTQGRPFLNQKDDFLNPGEIILTFDDGPAPDNTKSIVEALRKAHAPALFFVLGSKLESEAAKSLAASESGHGITVGVHGYFHATPDDRGNPYTSLDWDTVQFDIKGGIERVTEATGKAPRFFRPPYGSLRPEDAKKIYRKLKLIPVGWTIDSEDWKTKNPGELFSKLTSMIRQRGKGIVLMHDVHPQSRAVVVKLLPWLKDNGFTVVPPARLKQAFAQ